MKRAGLSLLSLPLCFLLLKSNLSACFLKLFLKTLSLFLADRLFDDLRSGVNEVLSFLQAETCSSTDDLDDLDLGCADLCKLNVELCLLFLFSCLCCRTCDNNASFSSIMESSLIASMNS